MVLRSDEGTLNYPRRGVNDPVLPNLTVQQLEYLVAAAREPTFARAAASVGVSPSALSQGLAELERRVGVALFEASGRGRVLADQGEEVVRYAERVLADTGELARWVDGRRTGRAGPLRVGMIDVAAVDHFSEPLRAFRRERPEVELRLTVAPSGEVLDLLGRGALDLAVCVAPEDAEGLAVTPLRDEPLAVYAPPGTRAGPPAGWGPWVTFPAGSRTRAIIADALRAAGARFEVVAESHQPEVLAEMVRLGVGWTVLPVIQAERAPAPLTRAVKGDLTRRSLVAAQRADRSPSPAADALVAALLG
jgi:DNA-binding transcriptional LysR family regulator